MITTFFDCNGMVHYEFLRRGDTTRSEDYCLVLARLREKIRKKCPHLWVMNGDWRTFLLHHDNATPHTGVLTLAALGENHMEMIPHPPYSLDLAPNDYFLYPELKAQMHGRAFRTIQEVQQAAEAILKSIPQHKFEEAIKDLPVRWAKCVQSGGDYFEGDGLQIPDFMVEVSDSDSETDQAVQEEDSEISN